MTLVWDEIGKRNYETGVDRGVIYPPDGVGVPWNGLTSVTENETKTSNSVFYEGVPIAHLVHPGHFEGRIQAFTYPNELYEFEGRVETRRGFYADTQRSTVFGLSYRTKVGNDLDRNAGYKIHLLYNVTAIPSDRQIETIGEEVDPTVFEWDIFAVPEEAPGIRPTAHFIIDSREFDSWFMLYLEEILYGGPFTQASLPPLSELVALSREWCRFSIFLDELTGLWTGEALSEDGVRELEEPGLVEVQGTNIAFLDDTGTIEIFKTCDESDLLKIVVVDNEDGTWTASTHLDELISVDEEEQFEINEANAIFTSSDTYELSDTPYET